MRVRECQIESPFPDTFRWVLENGVPENDEHSARPPIKFKEWLESEPNETPFWITGKPASGNSTLMKFICNNSKVQTHLRVWSGDQAGLLHTILYQLLRQQPDLCREVAQNRYVYYQLAGMDSPDPPDWTVEELRDSVIRSVSRTADTSRVAMFIDGLDEYDDDHEKLIYFLNHLQKDQNIKLCISSRPWNVFKDAFGTYPSLRMELLTRPDIEKYNLKSQIIERADGVFLWVVLVTEKLIATTRENNDLCEIWKVFADLPPGLEELYGSIRRRLDKAQRERASRMYQLFFLWNKTLDCPLGIVEFWMAINCHDPTVLQPSPAIDEIPKILAMMERRIVGATGGILQIFRVPRESDASRAPAISIGFLHRTVSDWLQGIESSIVADGPPGYDPCLVLTSVFVSWMNFVYGKSGCLAPELRDVFMVARSCNDSADSRAKLLVIIERLQIRDAEKALAPYSDSGVRSFLAARYLCAPYLQAKLESASGVIGIELPPHLQMVPAQFWSETERAHRVNILLHLFLDTYDTSRYLEDLNMRLRIFGILLQAKFAPPQFNEILREDLGDYAFEPPLRTLTSLRRKRATTNIRRGFREYMHDQKLRVKYITKEMSGSKSDVSVKVMLAAPVAAAPGLGRQVPEVAR
ncbi:P-loop-containing protein [Corynascus novoguineensis]|uniref:P-loop-containing protein n=1 Tax=Corynascus novoguineensis TaxID=1126955 RepID=A0AAN7HKU4_9PEZI|nr:P-loop-containing protein [Corynascus novoguineensis]